MTAAEIAQIAHLRQRRSGSYEGGRPVVPLNEL